MDTIFISDFRLEILIGVYEWERRVPQTVQLDLEIGLPSRAKRSDKIGDTIDYAKVVGRIEQSLIDNRFLLVEALA
ncbi:MAG: dihydroneopterin aldolase, partial [Burkholderiales bacterium]